MVSVFSNPTSHQQQCKQTSPTPTPHSSYLLSCPCTSLVSEWVFSLQLPCIIKDAVEVYCSGAELQHHYRPLQRLCLTSDRVKHQSTGDPCFTHVFPQWRLREQAGCLTAEPSLDCCYLMQTMQIIEFNEDFWLYTQTGSLPDTLTSTTCNYIVHTLWGMSSQEIS